MRKWVLIPIIKLGQEPQGAFLQVLSEPKWFGRTDFTGLKTSGLGQAVAAVEQVLAKLMRRAITPSYLYLGNYFLNLTELKTGALGLVLAVFMQHNACGYRKIIALGDVDVSRQNLPISAGMYFETQLKAVLNMGKQQQPLPLFIPASELDGVDSMVLKQRLTELNFHLMPVGNLFEALAELGLSNKHLQKP